MSKITFYPLIVVLSITCLGFYFLYSEKTQLATDVDLLQNQIDIIKNENRDLKIRIRALEDASLKGVSEKATKTIKKSIDTMLNALDQKIEEAKRLNQQPKKYTEQTEQTEQTSTE